jgi:Prp8 binding protein
LLYLVLVSSAALWKTYPPHTNTASLASIHKAAILDLQFSLLRPHLYTCSADQTLAITDITTGVRQRKYLAHDGVVNSIDRARSGGGGRELVISGGDDGVVRCWDQDVEGKRAVIELEGNGVPTTAVCWSGDGAQVFVGGIDNEIQVSLLPFPCLSGRVSLLQELANGPLTGYVRAIV